MATDNDFLLLLASDWPPERVLLNTEQFENQCKTTKRQNTRKQARKTLEYIRKLQGNGTDIIYTSQETHSFHRKTRIRITGLYNCRLNTLSTGQTA